MAKKVEFNLEIVKKYIFWVCVPIGLVLAVFTGWTTVGSVATDLENQKKQLEQQKSTIQKLRGEAAKHPNEQTVAEINKDRKELKDKILTAWEMLEKDQRDQNSWEGLSSLVVREIEGKNFLDTLSSTALNNYLNFARDEMNKLLEKSKIERRQLYKRYPDGREEAFDENPLEVGNSGSGGSGMGGSRRGSASGSSMSSRSDRGTASRRTGGTRGGSSLETKEYEEVLKGKVIWDSPHLDVTMRDWQQQPQSFEVWLTQEDLWVYQALLSVVAQSNIDSASPRNAVIKQIVELSIGKNAAQKLETQSMRRIAGAGLDSGMGSGMGSSSSYGGSNSYGGSLSRGSYGGGTGMGTGEGGNPEEFAKAEAMAGRYVDAAGQPLLEADLTGQFRRMPIYLCFVVDQQRISDILVNCANCSMPIDVMWVTVNPDATASFDFASATSSSGSSSYGGGGNSTSRRGGTSRSSTMSSRSGSGSTETIIGWPTDRSGGLNSRGGNTAPDFGPDVATIEIFGCINIFAKPDDKKIEGSENVSETGGGSR